jgi:hypothetical protein
MGNHSLSVSRCGIYIGLFGIIEMNERIKQLAKEAAREMNETGTYSEPKFQEKFAELIVREYEKLLPEICPWVDADKEGPMKGWHVQFVARKHFGVEE